MVSEICVNCKHYTAYFHEFMGMEYDGLCLKHVIPTDIYFGKTCSTWEAKEE